MGDYSVPETIRAMKPRGTIVKRLKGHYYVYTCRNEKRDDGKWHLTTGKAIGSVREGIGFVPNDGYNSEGRASVLEYGRYAPALTSSLGELERLERHFNPLEATEIYVLALLFCADGYMPLKSVGEHYTQSYLSVRYPSLRMGASSLSGLLDSLGRYRERQEAYQQELLGTAGNIAVDGHCVESYSRGDCLAQYGNKYGETGEMQVNLLVAYDISGEAPVLARMYPGGMLDKTSVRDLLSGYRFRGKLFIVDRGFYSAANLELLSRDGNDYIIPLSENLEEYKGVAGTLDYRQSFVYHAGGKPHPVFFHEGQGIKSGRVIIYRDMDRAAYEEDSFKKRIGTSAEYTEERLGRLRDGFGVMVLRTSLDSAKGADEVFRLYKRRWSIETYNDILKNRDGFVALGQGDYYVTQGLSFVVLVAGRIEAAFRRKCKDTKNTGRTPDDILLSAQFVKIQKRDGKWETINTSKKLIELFNAFDCPVIGNLGLPT